MAGTNLYWGHGEDALRELAEAARDPGLPQRPRARVHPRRPRAASSRARASTALKGADVALVVGVPMDFRLGFGKSFGDETEIVAIDVAEPERDHPRRVADELYGDLPAILSGLAEGRRASTPAAGSRRSARPSARSARPSASCARTARAPLHPMRLYAELGEVLDRDAIVIGDGGDFVSYAGRVIDSYEPGCWLDPGPFGCLGSGPGYALAAKLAHPDRQVVLLLGDGAFGFSGMEFDTLARHGVNVVGVMGNNGIWGLEKHPMEFLYGYSVAADLRPETRYDQVVEALGGHGELVREPGELRPALERALGAGGRRSSTCSRTRASPTRARRTWPETRSRPRRGRAASRLAPSGRAGVRALGGLLGGPNGGRRR